MPTNFDKIKNMTPEELGYFIWTKDAKCGYCSKIYDLTEEELKNNPCDIRTCHLYITKWLNSKAE